MNEIDKYYDHCKRMSELPKLRRKVTDDQKQDIAHNKSVESIDPANIDARAQMQQVYDDMGIEIPKGADPAKLAGEPLNKRAYAEAIEAFKTTDPDTKEMWKDAQQLSHHNHTVLITGDTGTGKELIARILHGSRDIGSFIPISTLVGSLFHSELFGYVKGAFSGAIQDTPGKIAAAAGGTLFMDEIGDLPIEQQVILLRVIQDGKYYMVGGHKPQPVNCRWIFATNKNIKSMIAEYPPTFRPDLYFRIAQFELAIKPFEQRHDDVVLLAEMFKKKLGSNIKIDPSMIPFKQGGAREIYRWVLRQEVLGKTAEEAR